jgi:2-dehydro-3-deoxygalactonokinase
MTDEARLIAIDWGSSRLRAWLMGPGGSVRAERGSDAGASVLSGGAPAFEAALHDLAGDWLAAGLPALACGMVGSAHGWREARYVACPADLAELHRHMVSVATRGGARLYIVPGLIDEPSGGTPDVMRGEETQLAGLLALDPALAGRATVLMPGTHSKWVQLRAGRVTGFRTRLTGELYAVLRQHSVLGRLMPAADAGGHPEAFASGVDTARRHGGADLSGQLFAVRTLGLTGKLPPEALPELLSGLLVGHELAAGLQHDGAPLVLVGDPALCQRYRQALQVFGTEAAAVHGNTATAGLWQLAHQAKLA